MSKPPSWQGPLIVFDLGNVLLRFSQERARRNFDSLDPGSGLPLVRMIWKTKTGIDFEKGRLSGREFHRQAKTQTGIRLGYEGFCQAFCEIFTPIPENLEILKRVARRHTTALLSNTNAIHWPYLFKKYPFLRNIDYPLASHTLRLMKPDPAIFSQVSRRTGFKFQDMVYVDDHPKFVAAARRLGIRGVCYTGQVPLAGLFAREGLVI